MAQSNTQFQSFLEEEVSKVRDVYYPIRAGLLRRMLVTRVDCRLLHPNPNDEFCDPDIGPNGSIISQYVQDYSRVDGDLSEARLLNSGIAEPLMVEKARPDGYIILNGHHRWAAALRYGMKKLPVRIVDLTQEKDIQAMLRKSGSDRRVSLDLDEVVFRPADAPLLEPALRFPLGRLYKERIRLGIPSLFHFLQERGYDIWVYTSQYYSLDYLKAYFRYYRVSVTGIVTGTARKGPRGTDTSGQLENLLNGKYESTLHISRDMVLRTVRNTKDFEDHPLTGSESAWIREIKDIIGEMK